MPLSAIFPLQYSVIITIVILVLQTRHLVHVAVTIFDDNDNPVINLGLVNPWMCEASLVSNQDR